MNDGIPTIQKIILGLQIFYEHDKNSDIAVGHDCIYVGDAELELSDLKKNVLIEAGWFIDEDTESWMHFI